MEYVDYDETIVDHDAVVEEIAVKAACQFCSNVYKSDNLLQRHINKRHKKQKMSIFNSFMESNINEKSSLVEKGI